MCFWFFTWRLTGSDGQPPSSCPLPCRLHHRKRDTHPQQENQGQKENDKKKAENKKTAEEVLKLALDGEDFTTLAKEYSDDSSASKGGDLGYFTQDEMVSAFSKAAFSLKTGEIYNKVVETSSGYHIIKKTGEKDQDFDDVKDDLIKTLESTKQSTLMQDLYTKYNVQIKNQ
mgnify:CR=1 FL=1